MIDLARGVVRIVPEPLPPVRRGQVAGPAGWCLHQVTPGGTDPDQFPGVPGVAGQPVRVPRRNLEPGARPEDSEHGREPVTFRLFAVDLAEHRAVRVGELTCDPAAKLGDINAGDSPLARNSLVEAKTSKHLYNLPAKDERALWDYAQKLKNPSPIIFPLRLILIIGPNPDAKLAKRLNHLETAARVPVRYCSAVALAAFLRLPPTGVTAEDLFEAFLVDDRIISMDHLVSISSKSQERLIAFRNWIGTTLG